MTMKNQAEAVQEAVPEAQMPNILTEMQRRAEAQLRIAQDIAVQERDSLIYLKCSILELLTVCEDAFPHAMLVYKNGTVSVSFDDEAGFAPAATVKELAELLAGLVRVVAIRDAKAGQDVEEVKICD